MAGRTGVTVGARPRASAVVAAIVVVAAVGCSTEPDVATREVAPIDDRPVDELPADAAIPDDLDVTIDTLANGLTYYIRHNDRPDGRAELRLVVDADRVDSVDELEDFADQGAALQRLTIDDVRAFVARYLPADQYIEITVLPR